MSSGHQWRKGVVFDFSLTQEEKVGGWWVRARRRERQGMETAASSASHLIFPTVFGLFTSSGVSDRFIPCPGSNQHQVGGSQAGLWGLPAAQSPTQASMTNRLGFPCHNIPLPNPRLTPRLSPSSLLSHSPAPFLALFAMSSSLQGATVAVKQRDPHRRSLLLSLSSNRFCSLCCFGVGVRMLIPKTANLTPADSTLPRTP